MNESMNLARFQELADAYGSVVARWPELERAAAMRLAADPSATAVLAQAVALDDVLDVWEIEAASDTLRTRILAEAPTSRRSLTGRARLWWSGVGIAAALAGAIAGTAAVTIMQTVDAAAVGSTSFGDAGPQEG